VRGRWKDLSNVFRQDPFRVTNLPTIIKITGDRVSLGYSLRFVILKTNERIQKWARLVEADVNDQKKLVAFVGA
jgi:hypothetical protein